MRPEDQIKFKGLDRIEILHISYHIAPVQRQTYHNMFEICYVFVEVELKIEGTESLVLCTYHSGINVVEGTFPNMPGTHRNLIYRIKTYWSNSSDWITLKCHTLTHIAVVERSAYCKLFEIYYYIIWNWI